MFFIHTNIHIFNIIISIVSYFIHQSSLTHHLQSMNPDQIAYVMEGLTNMRCDFEGN